MIMVMMGANDGLVAFFANLGIGWVMTESYISKESTRNPAIAQATQARKQLIEERQ